MGAMARRLALLTFLLTLAGLLGLDASPAAAQTTFTVTTAADLVNPGDGLLSLREAIDLANGDGDDSRIDLMAGQTHTLAQCNAGAPQEVLNASGDLNASDAENDLLIVGAGATIDQLCADERVLQFAGANLRLEAVTITGGDLELSGSTVGGGIQLGGEGLMTLVDTVVSGNTAQFGGGIEANRLVLENSVLTGNQAAVGGAVNLQGGAQSLTATGSSIFANTASNAPGVNFTGAGTASMTNTTVGGNTNNAVNFSVGSELNLQNGNATLVHSTILGTANAPALRVGGTLTSFGTVVDGGAGQSCNVSGSTVSQGFNIEAATNICGFDQSTDIVQAVDALGPLADNGGAGNTALPDAGGLLDGRIPIASCRPAVPTDARGVARPSGTGCEPGAIELVSRAVDGQIRNGNQATFAGTNVINTTGAGQTRSQNRAVGQKATFFVRFRNAGGVVDGIKVRGPAGTNRFTVRYFREHQHEHHQRGHQRHTDLHRRGAGRDPARAGGGHPPAGRTPQRHDQPPGAGHLDR